jgi:hypothetical protein
LTFEWHRVPCYLHDILIAKVNADTEGMIQNPYARLMSNVKVNRPDAEMAWIAVHSPY